MDNRIFNVNGSGDEMLKAAIDLVFQQEGSRTACRPWLQTKEHGLVLLWADGVGGNDLPASLDSSNVFSIVRQWLDGEFAQQVELSRWCQDADHDGSNKKGWQVYCEDWGHVADNHYAICGIKPAFIWLGK